MHLLQTYIMNKNCLPYAQINCEKLLRGFFGYVRMQSLAKQSGERNLSIAVNPLTLFGKPIVNANLTISTNYGDRHALVTSSLAGKGASVMPVAAAARAWLAGNTGT
ncbi:MAG TPA: hypothetical protein VF988_12350, partial [Verrucomicrobiae bacterium]